MEHGHTLLEFIMENDRKYSIDMLREKIFSLYGDNVLFYTCSAEGMTFNQLMTFLFERGKIALEDGLLTMFPERMCHH